MTQDMIDNVEREWQHLSNCIGMLNHAERMHEKVMKYHDADTGYLSKTAQMSSDMVCQMWNLTMEATMDMAFTLESLLNKVQEEVK